jgi:hypothetical protein
VSSLISSGKTVAYTTAYYDSTIANYLVNGYSTWDNWKIGFYQTAWFIRIDLGENYTLDYCRFCWSQWIAAGVLAPSSIKVFVGTATSAYSTAHIMTTFSTEDILHSTVWSSNAPLTGNNRYVDHTDRNVIRHPGHTVRGRASVRVSEAEFTGASVYADEGRQFAEAGHELFS